MAATAAASLLLMRNLAAALDLLVLVADRRLQLLHLRARRRNAVVGQFGGAEVAGGKFLRLLCKCMRM